MLRNSIGINGRDFLLAQGTDIDELKSAAVAVLRDGVGFLEFTVVGNRRVSILLSPGVSVAFESAEVVFDERDTGDLEHPFFVVDAL